MYCPFKKDWPAFLPATSIPQLPGNPVLPRQFRGDGFICVAQVCISGCWQVYSACNSTTLPKMLLAPPLSIGDFGALLKGKMGH